MLRNLWNRFQTLPLALRWTIGVSSAVALALMAASFYLIYPYGQICGEADRTGHKDCASYHLLFVGLWHINKVLTAYGASIIGVATVCIAFFTGTLWWSTTKMQEATEATLKQLEREYVSTHRPRLRVRNVAFVEAIKPTTEPLHDTIEYQVVNIGETEARVIQSNVTIWTYSQPDWFASWTPRYDASGNDAMGQFTLENGRSRELTRLGGDRLVNRLESLQLSLKALKIGSGDWLKASTTPIFFYGYIRYEDSDGRQRRTAFYRRYDPEKRRFVIIDDPDYEYED
jgi:hypothetical protein